MPAASVSHRRGLDGLGDASNLVDLEQETVAGLLLDGSLDSLGVRDGQVVTDDLDLGLGGECLPGLPVILVEWIFNRDDGVFLDQRVVVVSELLSGDPLGLTVKETSKKYTSAIDTLFIH